MKKVLVFAISIFIISGAVASEAPSSVGCRETNISFVKPDGRIDTERCRDVRDHFCEALRTLLELRGFSPPVEGHKSLHKYISGNLGSLPEEQQNLFHWSMFCLKYISTLVAGRDLAFFLRTSYENEDALRLA
jgi:hypothetical protein